VNINTLSDINKYNIKEIGIMMILVGLVIGLYMWTKFVLEIGKEIGEDKMNQMIAKEKARANALDTRAKSYEEMYESKRRLCEIMSKEYERKCEQYKEKCEQYKEKCVVYDILLEDYTETVTKLDSIKTVELIDNYEYDEDNSTMKNNHRIVIEKAIEELKAENLINNYITIELTEEEDFNCYHRSRLNNGQIIDRKIYMNYNLSDEGYEFMINYIANKYGLDISEPESLALFVFLHEFGHYIDSTLEHEEDYEEVNNELKDLLILIDDDKEAQIAYREIPEEEFADKWAVDFMKAHFAKELCAC
jgi:hypothetical protein